MIISCLFPSLLYQVLRNLSDRSYDKRKLGATEIERIIKRLRETSLNSSDYKQSTLRILQFLTTEFANSNNSNNRKGGLIGLASCAIGLTVLSSEYLDIMIPAILRNFNDAEPRVRYYACEALFNVAKVTRSNILPYFNDIFTGVCKLIADVDAECKNGAASFDRLLKEIVLESFQEYDHAMITYNQQQQQQQQNSNTTDINNNNTVSPIPSTVPYCLDLEKFIPLLRTHMNVINPYVRQLLIGWITALDSIPGIDILDKLPLLLEGILEMLSDVNREVKQHANAALANFLDRLDNLSQEEAFERIQFVPIMEILLVQTGREKDNLTRVSAIEWISQLLKLGGYNKVLTSLYDRLVSALLRCLSDPDIELVEKVARANADLMMLVRTSNSSTFDSTKLVQAILVEVSAKDRVTRSAALRWIAALLTQVPDTVCLLIDQLLPVLLSNLLDTGDSEVLKLDIEVLARLGIIDTKLLVRVLIDFIKLLGEHRTLLEAKASFIIRRLCLLLEPRIIYLTFATILERESNREFASLVIELLNLILLTSLETVDFRESLRSCAAPSTKPLAFEKYSGALSSFSSSSHPNNDTSSHLSIINDQTISLVTTTVNPISIFLVLYRTWTCNPIATVSLCLLCQSYELTYRLVFQLNELTITVGLLMQIDKLIQLFESPIFLTTRMHLLQPEREDTMYLLRSLYGLLMLLPQGTAFSTLRERLHSVTNLHLSLQPSLVTHSSVSSTTTSSTTTATTTKGYLPFDINEVFQSFVERQRITRELLTNELKQRSLLLVPSSSSNSSPNQPPNTGQIPQSSSNNIRLEDMDNSSMHNIK